MDKIDILAGIEAMAAGLTYGTDQPIAALPGPECDDWNAGQARNSAYGV
jgi:hypothetical protein